MTRAEELRGLDKKVHVELSKKFTPSAVAYRGIAKINQDTEWTESWIFPIEGYECLRFHLVLDNRITVQMDDMSSLNSILPPLDPRHQTGAKSMGIVEESTGLFVHKLEELGAAAFGAAVHDINKKTNPEALFKLVMHHLDRTGGTNACGGLGRPKQAPSQWDFKEKFDVSYPFDDADYHRRTGQTPNHHGFDDYLKKVDCFGELEMNIPPWVTRPFYGHYLRNTEWRELWWDRVPAAGKGMLMMLLCNNSAPWRPSDYFLGPRDHEVLFDDRVGAGWRRTRLTWQKEYEKNL